MAEIDDSFPLTGFLQVYIEFSALYLVASEQIPRYDRARTVRVPWAPDCDRSLVRIGDYSDRIHPKTLEDKTS